MKIYLASSLALSNFSCFSDEYKTLYPYAPDPNNNANFFVYTKEEIEQMNIVTDIVS